MDQKIQQKIDDCVSVEDVRNIVKEMGGIDGPQMPYSPRLFNKVLEDVIKRKCSIYYIPSRLRKKVSELLAF